MRPQAEGFAVLAVLAVLAVVGLYVAGTFQDALFGTALSSARIYQQRAFELADIGIDQALRQLGTATAPVQFVRDLHPLAESNSRVHVEVQSGPDVRIATGYSAGRIVARHYEITSTGYAPRNARSVQKQGVVRLVPVAMGAP
jgi:Tfp pilus assembly protein PilX